MEGFVVFERTSLLLKEIVPYYLLILALSMLLYYLE